MIKPQIKLQEVLFTVQSHSFACMNTASIGSVSEVFNARKLIFEI